MSSQRAVSYNGVFLLSLLCVTEAAIISTITICIHVFFMYRIWQNIPTCVCILLDQHVWANVQPRGLAFKGQPPSSPSTITTIITIIHTVECIHLTAGRHNSSNSISAAHLGTAPLFNLVPSSVPPTPSRVIPIIFTYSRNIFTRVDYTLTVLFVARPLLVLCLCLKNMKTKVLHFEKIKSCQSLSARVFGWVTWSNLVTDLCEYIFLFWNYTSSKPTAVFIVGENIDLICI